MVLMGDKSEKAVRKNSCTKHAARTKLCKTLWTNGLSNNV